MVARLRRRVARGDFPVLATASGVGALWHTLPSTAADGVVSSASPGFLMLMILVAPVFAAGLAECPRAYNTEEILEAAAMAEMYFTKVDATGFQSSHDALQARLACSKDILSQEAVARVHRVEALAALLDGRPERIPLALAGLFAAEPGHQIPSSLLPDGHPVRGSIPAAMLDLRDDSGVAVPPLASGWIEVDGVHAQRAPVQRAAILQQIDGQGVAVATHYRWPDEAGFDWIVVGEDPTPTAVTLPRPVKKQRASPVWARRGSLLGVTVASLAASGAMYALAADAHRQFEGSPTLGAEVSESERAAYREELEGIQSRANGLSWGCYAAAGAGLALGVVTVVTW